MRHELLQVRKDRGIEQAGEWLALFRTTSAAHATLLKHLQCAPRAHNGLVNWIALGPVLRYEQN